METTTPPDSFFSLYFGVDFAILSFFRILLGFVCLVELLILLPSVDDFFTHQGMIPAYTFPSLYRFSLSKIWIYSVYALHFLVSLFLMVGLFTKISTVITWVLFVSLFHGAPFFVHKGDVLLTSLLFWSMFVPLGRRFSLDRHGNGNESTSPGGRVTSIGTMALVLQAPIVYFSSGLEKVLNANWLTEPLAVYHALYPSVATTFGHWFVSELPYWGLLVATFMTLILEILVPLVMFFPVGFFGRNRRTYLAWFRMVGVGVLAFFQLGIGLTTMVGLFPVISVLGTLPLLPSRVASAVTELLVGMPTRSRGDVT